MRVTPTMMTTFSVVKTTNLLGHLVIPHPSISIKTVRRVQTGRPAYAVMTMFETRRTISARYPVANQATLGSLDSRLDL